MSYDADTRVAVALESIAGLLQEIHTRAVVAEEREVRQHAEIMMQAKAVTEQNRLHVEECAHWHRMMAVGQGDDLQ